MTGRERLIGLLREAYDDYICDDTAQQREKLADYLLANGVVVLPLNQKEIILLATEMIEKMTDSER